MSVEFLAQSVDLAVQTAQRNHQNNIDMNKIDEASKEFEALFVSEMLKPMFEGIKTDGMFGGGKGEEIFRGFMLQEYGEMLAETQSIGLSAQVKQAMIDMQIQANQAAGMAQVAQTGIENAYITANHLNQKDQ